MANHRFDWKWNLTDLHPDKDVNVFTTFSCGGGSSMGYKRAGFHVLGNVEIDPKINVMYKLNHNPQFNYCMDLREFNKLDDLPDDLYHLDILDGSPPCFVAGTPVMTKGEDCIAAPKAIEKVKVGDLVLTHRGRWRRVTAVMDKYTWECVDLLFAGRKWIRTTPNHPFYIRTSTQALPMGSGAGTEIFSQANWIEAGDLMNVAQARLDGKTIYGAQPSISNDMVEGAVSWVPLLMAKRSPAGKYHVYNLSVEEDESYTVYNVAVHNCTVFSMAGQREKTWGKEKQFREGQKKQVLDDLFFVYLDTLEKLRPKVAIAENVMGLLKGNAKGYVNQIIKRYREIGYDVQMFALNSGRMDVPQARQRVFFIANRMGYPKLTMDFHYDAIPFGDVRSEHGVPVSETSAVYALIKKAAPTDRTLEDTLKRATGKGNMYFGHQIIPDKKIAPCITSAGSYYRYYDKTLFSDDDFRNVQTFPQDYDFLKNSVQYVCGMSVPPNMMANIATEVYDQWLSKKE